MQNQISTFNFKSQPVRIQSVNNEPYFCLTDVCFVLGVNRRSSEAFRLNEKGCNKIAVPTQGGVQEIVFINEPNLYRIIFRSNKSQAIDFQNWVFEEVLPQIRKTGHYQVQQQELALPEPEPKFSRELTERQWLKLASLWFACYNNLELLGKIYQPLNALGSPYGVTAYTHATEYQTTLGALQRLLVPLLAEFDVDPRQEAHYYRALRTLREYEPKGLGAIVRI